MNMPSTENAMGALAKLAYKHLDGTHVTQADLLGVISMLPFKQDECEAQTTHRLFLDQLRDSNSILNSQSVKPAALEALNRIREHVQETEGDSSEIKIVRYDYKQILMQENL